MIPSDIMDKIRGKGILESTEDAKIEFAQVLVTLGIDLETTFAHFFINFAGPGFKGKKGFHFDHICWSYIYSDYQNYVEYFWEKRTWGILPKSFLPLRWFEGEATLLYCSETDFVFWVDEEEINEILNGEASPKWKSFNEFLLFVFG